MNEHYICTGECSGVSDIPGTCQAPDCSKHNETLVACGCSAGPAGHAPAEMDDKTVTDASDE